jgi:carbohydrate kinase (thermoresistant glucokinase family)
MASASNAAQPGHSGRWVMMGVSGCGKSTIGAALAHHFDVPFLEGDAFHPADNVVKMSAGTPLDDNDRAGWLQVLATEIRQARENGTGLVLSCSALKRHYRDLLRQADPELHFVHLNGPRPLISERMQARVGHYMPPSLLDSQLSILEPLQDDEAGVTLDIALPPQLLIERITESTGRTDQARQPT